MKITGLHVDGYGVLADLSIEDLSPGLTVVLGANEAGKSTLLDFIRGVLFGFPDRRHRASVHAPLRGGRHGGALRLSDEDARSFVLERHVDARRPLLSGPDGELIDEARLAVLLGGADEALFRTVFAFGLGELMAFESLDRDEVRDVVFSAGVLGAGRSATKAGRAIEQRRSEIVRPRRHDARANQLQHRLDEIDAALRVARRGAEGYASSSAACSRLTACVRSAREHADALNHRAAELERISLCWPFFVRRGEASSQLEELGTPDPREEALVSRIAEIRELAAAASGHDERRQQRAERSGQLATIEAKLAALDSALNLAPDAVPTAPPPAVVERIRRLADEHATQLAGATALRDEVERSARGHAELADLLDRSGAGRAVRDEETLRRLSIDLGELRRLARERDQLRLDRSSADREERLALLAAPRPRQWDLPPAAALLIALLVLATVVTSTASRSLHAVSLSLASLAVVLIALTIARARRHHAPAFSGATPRPASDDLALEARIGELATSLGLDAAVVLGAMESCAERLEVERGARRELDELARRVHEARERFAEASARHRAAARRIAELEGQARDEAVQLGLAPCAPMRLLDALDALAEASELKAARSRLLRGLAALDDQLAHFMARFTAAEQACGAGDQGEDLATRIARLVADLDAATARRAARAELAATIATADDFLFSSLGSGPSAERLRAEIASGAVLAWQEEREHLDEATKEAEVAYEAVRDELKETERSLVELARSDEIARLEIEREGCAAALDAALSDWLVLGVARSMLDQTLARYERERQPRVISLARDLFSEVTDGRYVALVARDDAEAAGHRGIEVIDRSGARASASELSRGTAEQLYLCLRLAFASTFAEQSAPLPFVLDDVLVNFDPERAAAVARAVVRTAETQQVLAFTCHPHIAEHFRTAQPTVRVVELEATG